MHAKGVSCNMVLYRSKVDEEQGKFTQNNLQQCETRKCREQLFCGLFSAANQSAAELCALGDSVLCRPRYSFELAVIRLFKMMCGDEGKRRSPEFTVGIGMGGST